MNYGPQSRDVLLQIKMPACWFCIKAAFWQLVDKLGLILLGGRGAILHRLLVVLFVSCFDLSNVNRKRVITVEFFSCRPIA